MADIKAIVGVCREDHPADVDEAYGEGTYARLFPVCPQCDGVDQFCKFCEGSGKVTASQAEEWHRQNRTTEYVGGILCGNCEHTKDEHKPGGCSKCDCTVYRRDTLECGCEIGKCVHVEDED